MTRLFVLLADFEIQCSAWSKNSAIEEEEPIQEQREKLSR